MAGQTKNIRLASAAVALSGAIWGCFWIPARYFDERGMDDGLLSTALFGVTVLALLPLALMRFGDWRPHARPLILIGFWTGAAFALYANALVYTEVVRALLLFYLTPVWGTLLGVVMLGERLNAYRIAAVVLGLAGGVTILGTGGGLPLPRNTGDWMALVSGITWALAMVYMARSPDAPISGQTFSYSAGSLVFSVILMAMLMPAGAPVTLPPLDAELIAAFLAFALLINLPCMTCLIWGAGRLSPGRVGILLCMELVFGVISAALLIDEPFGIREIAGTALIIAAVLVEIAQPQPTDIHGAQET